MGSPPKHLTGDKAGIQEFLDKFDVRTDQELSMTRNFLPRDDANVTPKFRSSYSIAMVSTAISPGKTWLDNCTDTDTMSRLYRRFMVRRYHIQGNSRDLGDAEKQRYLDIDSPPLSMSPKYPIERSQLNMTGSPLISLYLSLRKAGGLCHE